VQRNHERDLPCCARLRHQVDGHNKTTNWHIRAHDAPLITISKTSVSSRLPIQRTTRGHTSSLRCEFPFSYDYDLKLSFIHTSWMSSQRVIDWARHILVKKSLLFGIVHNEASAKIQKFARPAFPGQPRKGHTRTAQASSLGSAPARAGSAHPPPGRGHEDVVRARGTRNVTAPVRVFQTIKRVPSGKRWSAAARRPRPRPRPSSGCLGGHHLLPDAGNCPHLARCGDLPRGGLRQVGHLLRSCARACRAVYRPAHNSPERCIYW